MKRLTEVLTRWGWRAPALVVGAFVLLTLPWWGVRVLSHVSYFRARRVEVYGTHFLQPRQVLDRLRIDTTTSIFTDLGVLERRLALDPQIHSARIERRLPGTLLVRIEETLPAALVPTANGLRAADGSGRILPLDPSHVPVDLPVLPARDTALLRLLAEVRSRAPALYEQINTAHRAASSELSLSLANLTVRAPADVSAERLADIVPVERDLSRRRARAIEIDLRYRDQVIARLQ